MWIKSYIMTIVAVVLLSAVAEALMPETEMKKHISLVVGLLILFAIAKPIISISEFSTDNMFLKLDTEVSTSAKRISEKIENVQFEVVDTTFSDSLSQAIAKSINTNYGVKSNVEAVIKNGTVKNIKIDSEPNDDIRQFIRNTYGLECVFERDGG